MERAAADQPIITLPLRGDKSIESALRQMCLTRKHTRWATPLELGYPMRPPRFGEEDVYLPETVMQYLRRRGPLTPTELIPTGQPHLYSRWLKAASHPYDRKPTQLMTIEVDKDNLDDREIILDPALLLNYHVSRFKSARKRLASNPAPAPTVIWGRSRRTGIDVRSHSFLDGVPPRLDPNLVEVHPHSRRTYETHANFTVTIYQGVARIEDDLGVWEMDGMRLHQITRRHPTIRSQELCDLRNDMIRAEKKGYRTLNWTLMEHLTTRFSLSVNLGEPDFGVYPSMHRLDSPREISPMVGSTAHLLYLDAVPALDAITWCHSLERCGGGVIVTTTTPAPSPFTCSKMLHLTQHA
eukprot:2298199-Rhodomonas_salina.3